jgi:hypothetical protein
MPPGGGTCAGAEPGDVLLLSAEDDLANTVRPRLDAAEADVARIHALEAVTIGTDERPPILPWDLDIAEGTIRERKVRLVVIDPFMAFLDSEINSHRDQDVRRCLHRLALVARKTGAAIVLVRHLNKLASDVALYRGGGSIGIIGAARSGLIIGRHPDDPKIRVLASNKSNLGPPPPSLTYRLETVNGAARIAWGSETDLVANDVLRHPGRASTSDQCTNALKELMANGLKDSKELEEHLKAMGHSERAFKSARKKLGIRATKETFSGRWILAFPGIEKQGNEGGHEGGQNA